MPFNPQLDNPKKKTFEYPGSSKVNLEFPKEKNMILHPNKCRYSQTF